MASINISYREIADTKRLASILVDMKRKQNDIIYANKIADELYLHQPFILSLMMGYKMDLPPEELEAVIDLYIVAWEFYKNEPNVRAIPITRQHYERVEKENLQIFQKLDKTTPGMERENALNANINSLSAKALTALVFMEFNQNKTFKRMDPQTKAILLIGFISVIQCYGNIITGTHQCLVT